MNRITRAMEEFFSPCLELEQWRPGGKYSARVADLPLLRQFAREAGLRGGLISVTEEELELVEQAAARHGWIIGTVALWDRAG